MARPPRAAARGRKIRHRVALAPRASGKGQHGERRAVGAAQQVRERAALQRTAHGEHGGDPAREVGPRDDQFQRVDAALRVPDEDQAPAVVGQRLDLRGEEARVRGDVVAPFGGKHLRGEALCAGGGDHVGERVRGRKARRQEARDEQQPEPRRIGRRRQHGVGLAGKAAQRVRAHGSAHVGSFAQRRPVRAAQVDGVGECSRQRGLAGRRQGRGGGSGERQRGQEARAPAHGSCGPRRPHQCSSPNAPRRARALATSRTGTMVSAAATTIAQSSAVSANVPNGACSTGR